ncbi:hypothetical protein GH714_032325 [Hevea brasiliensis]|uniref:Uncharacterized protein n=1 Tax=Hevea brasiliensis TaxID=3981 RepID=A0A6A6LPL7_HEVBR|nr:hypothetical protein GH714_032325 [Hevea brasiliensis]
MQSLCSVTHLPNLEPRVFGCTVYVHIPKTLRNKLDPCAKRGSCYTSSSRESSSKENVLQEGGVEFFQLEEMNEQFGILENEVLVPVSIPLEVGPELSVPLEVGPESQVIPLEDRSESPMLAELPVITPLIEESTQNVQNAFRQEFD